MENVQKNEIVDLILQLKEIVKQNDEFIIEDKKYKEKRNIIINKYNKYKFIINNKTDESYTYIGENNIYISGKDWNRNSYDGLFIILHEIGHLETNTLKMSKAKREFEATKWAINESKKLNMYYISDTLKYTYELDIKDKLIQGESKDNYCFNW